MILTNRGLKIRLPLRTCFGWMAKLYPKVDAYKIFSKTEGMEYIPGLLRDIAAVVCFYNQLEPIFILESMVSASVIGWIILAFGLFIVPYLVALATVYSRLGGFGILLAINTGVAYYFSDLNGVMFYFIGVAISALITGVILDYIYIWFMNKKMKAYFKDESEEFGPDCALTISEACFINSLRHYARNLNLSPNFIDLPDKDFHVSNWSNVFLDYAEKYPECVARYDGMKIYQEILVNDKEYDRDEYDGGKEDYKEHGKNESGQDLFCGFCGKKNQPCFKFCTECGKALDKLEAEEVDEEEHVSPKLSMFFVAAKGTIALIIISILLNSFVLIMAGDAKSFGVNQNIQEMLGPTLSKKFQETLRENFVDKLEKGTGLFLLGALIGLISGLVGYWKVGSSFLNSLSWGIIGSIYLALAYGAGGFSFGFGFGGGWVGAGIGAMLGFWLVSSASGTKKKVLRH